MPMSETTTPIDFDIDRYMRASKRLDLSEVDWDDIPSHPLSDGDVMCMHYMMDIETHTVIYLRDSSRRGRPTILTSPPFCRAGCTRSSGTARRSPSSSAAPGSRSRPSRDCRTDRRRCPATEPGQAASREARRGPPAAPPPDDDRLDGHPALHRPAHDVGRDQRAHHAHRLLPADPPVEPPGAAPSCGGSSRTSGGTSRSTARRPCPARGRTGPARRLVRWILTQLLDACGRGRKVGRGGRRTRASTCSATPTRVARPREAWTPCVGDARPRGPDAARGRARRGAHPCQADTGIRRRFHRSRDWRSLTRGRGERCLITRRGPGLGRGRGDCRRAARTRGN